MKDGSRTEEQAQVSRQEVYKDYENCYLQLSPEIRPCRDPSLLKKAAQYLLREPEVTGTLSGFRFYQAVKQDCIPLSTDSPTHLSAFIKATELLETLCVSLFLQPWKKEIKTLKTFTGQFVYGLLPVLSSSTIQSVLASIGYLPHTDTPQSEYRLSEDANPERAMLLGFELLLARVECYHLLQLLEKDQLGPQEWLDVLQRKVGPTKMDEATEKKTTVVQMEEEEKKKEEADVKDVPLYLDNRLEVKPQPKPGRCHLNSVDQSIIEMEKSYPDLAFRGRLLLPHKPQRANSSKSSSKDVHLPSINDYSDVSKAAELPKKDCIKGTRVNATTVHSKDDGIKADEVLGDDGRGIGCNDRNSGGTTAPGDTMSSSSSTSTNTSTTDGSRVHDELSEPQAVSLHIILRAGSKAEQSLKPGEPHPTAEPPARTQQTVADLQNKRAANPKTPSLCSMDEEQELIELAERMDQLHVQGEEVKRKKKHKIEEENTNKERRKKGRKASTERESEEQNIRMEAGPALSHAASRCTRSSQSDPVLMKEQPDVCHHSPLSISAAEHQSCEGGSTGQQQGEDTVRGEEEQLAQSFVIVEHHKK